MQLVLLLIVALCMCNEAVARRRNDGSKRPGKMKNRVKRGFYKVCSAVKILEELHVVSGGGGGVFRTCIHLRLKHDVLDIPGMLV